MTPSRRGLLSSSVALAAVGTPIASAADHPDSVVFALCRQHAENLSAFNAKGTLESDDCPLWDAYERSRDAITATKPKTLAGLAAIARIAKLEAIDPAGEEHPDNTPAAEWAWNIVHLLAGLDIE